MTKEETGERLREEQRRHMSVRVADDAAKVFADPTAYADEASLHAALRHLRANAPVSWVDAPPGYRPFWAITKHADIMAIERANDLFTNSPRPVLTTAEGDIQQAAMGVSTLIHMDDPQHRKVRAIGADWFRPKAMRALKVRVDELAKSFVDQMADRGGDECDFVQEVAVNFPLYVIMSLLGIPESDFHRMLTYTQELFGSDDTELRRGATIEERGLALFDMFTYFNEITAARRAQPPRIWRRRSPTLASTANRSPTSTRCPTTSSSPPPVTTPPVPPSRVGCRPSSSIPTSCGGFRPTRA